jgi:TonB dependent receptor.
LINARASLALKSVPGLSVGVWGRNLSDEQVIQSSFIAGFADGVYYAIPRTYGASIEYKF